MTEKLLEKKPRFAVTKPGGLVIENANPYFSGLPDRTVSLPGGRTAFVELKTTGKGNKSP